MKPDREMARKTPLIEFQCCGLGKRNESCLVDAWLLPVERFILPNSISAIIPLIGQVLVEMESQHEKGAISQV